jgi:hypothetical protein
MGEPVRPLLHALGISIDTKYVVPEMDEGVRDCDAEPPQANYHYVVV